MPRRATLTYTSEDARARGLAPGGGGATTTADAPGKALKIYYCRATGAAALATDADLASLPTRRTDGAAILDTTAATLRLYAEEAGTVLLTRRGYAVGAPDTVEVQRRLAVGGVPVAYRAGPGPAGGGGGHNPNKPDLGRFLYILPDALSPHLPGSGGDGGGEEGEGAGGEGGPHAPPPPVALRLRGGGCQLAVRLDFGGGGAGKEADEAAASIVGVTPEWATLRLPPSLRGNEAAVRAAVAAAVAAALDARRSAVAVTTGPDAGSRVVLVTGVGPPEAFECLVRAVAAG